MARLIVFMFFIVAATATDFAGCMVITAPGVYNQTASFTANISPCITIAEGVKNVVITQDASRPYTINILKGQQAIYSHGSPGTSATDYGIVVSNLRITAWDLPGTPYYSEIMLFWCDWCTLVNTFTAGKVGGVDIRSSTHLTVMNNDLGGGLSLPGVTGNSYITNNQITLPIGTILWSGIFCGQCDSVVISNNWIDGAWYDTSTTGSDAGILIWQSNNMLITNNRVHHVMAEAYEFVAGNSNIVFTGNSAWASGYYCFAFAHGVSISGYLTAYGNTCYGMRFLPNGIQTAMFAINNDSYASGLQPCGSTLHMDNFFWHDNTYIRPDNNPSGSYLFYVNWSPNSCYTSFSSTPMLFYNESWGKPASDYDAGFFKSASAVSGTNMVCRLSWNSDSQIPFVCQ